MSNALVSAISDAASLIGVPTDTAKQFLNRRQEKLQDIILQETRDGDFSNVHKDCIFSIVFRLLNDINEGVGKNNIRLLARSIVGLNNKEQLTASRFHYFNTILAPLSHDEIIFLAEIVKFYKYEGIPKEVYRPDSPKEMIAINKAAERTKKPYLLLSLLKTGFFEPFLRTNARIPYKISQSFVDFMDLINNWEDIANWSEE